MDKKKAINPRKKRTSKKRAEKDKNKVWWILLVCVVLIMILGIFYLILAGYGQHSQNKEFVSPTSAPPFVPSLGPEEKSRSPYPLDGIPSPTPLLPLSTPEPGQSDKTGRLGPGATPVPARYEVFIVIDDVGYNLGQLRSFLQFPGRLTFAVLPGLDYTAESSKLISEYRHDLILHQPLEAEGGQDPGPGLIRSGTERELVFKTLKSNLAPLKNVLGVNNHMGSKGTQDERLLTDIFDYLKKEGLFFLDSRTTGKSKGAELAQKLNLPFVDRDIFLDNVDEKEEITKYLEKGLAIAKRRGYVVMIGHVWSKYLPELLVESYDAYRKRGFTFLGLSSLMRPTEGKVGPFLSKEIDEGIETNYAGPRP